FGPRFQLFYTVGLGCKKSGNVRLWGGDKGPRHGTGGFPRCRVVAGSAPDLHEKLMKRRNTRLILASRTDLRQRGGDTHPAGYKEFSTIKHCQGLLSNELVIHDSQKC